MDAVEVPHMVLAQVLALLTQRERLGVCTLVDRTWEAAACELSNTIVMPGATADQVAALSSWITKHGHHITQLHITGHAGDGATPTLRQLPCARLCDLQLERCAVQLAARKPHPGVLAALPSLTRLVLGRGNTYIGAGRSLKALSGLTALQHLQCDGQIKQAPLALPAGVVSRLVQLTHLELGRIEVPDAALEGLSRACALRHLSLGSRWTGGGDIAPAAVAAIAGLQHLVVLQLWGPLEVISPSTTPGIGQLAALTKLKLMRAWCSEPAMLSQLVQLRSLSFYYCSLEGFHGGPAAVFSLLEALPSLQHLAELDLSGSLEEVAADAGRYSALTAGSQLQELNLADCAIPGDAWPAMFGRRLPQLASLIINHVQPALSGSHLQCIAASCPALSNLAMQGVAPTGECLAALAEMAALSDLTVSHVDDGDVPGLAQLTRLCSLWICRPNDVSLWGLVHLSRLTRLTQLGIKDPDPSQDPEEDDLDEPPAVSFWFSNKAFGDEPARDVWVQVSDMFDEFAEDDEDDGGF